MDTPEAWRRWLAGFPKEPPERMAIALAAVDAFGRCQQTGSLEQADLESVLKAASAPHKLIYGTGCRLLMKLAALNGQALESVRAAAQTGSAALRFRMMAYLERTLPEPFCVELLGGGLKDISARVRTFAVQRAELLGYRALLPALEALLADEKDPQVRSTLEFHLPLLRSGYGLTPQGDGREGFMLRVSYRGGLKAMEISSSDAEPRNVERLVNEVWKEHGRPLRTP
ncbi:MAG TPA: hypothetical protein VI589_00045 [Vicinamibacteria bacterium]